MTKRDYVAEILAARARGRTRDDLYSRYRLGSLVERINQAPQEYLEYFPVAAIAALESAFRICVRALVDFGPPHSDHAGDLINDAKVEVSALHAFHGRRISVGEFVAHLVPFRAFNDIDRSLTKLLGSSFMTAIKAVEDPWLRDEGKERARILPSHGPVFEDVKALIALRHQLAHEVSLKPAALERKALSRQLVSTERFAHGMLEVVEQMLHPNAPRTQMEMNVAAHQRAAEADEAMQKAYQAGLDRYDEESESRVRDGRDTPGAMRLEKEAFEATQDAFLKYRESAVVYAGSKVAGGSIRPMMESEAHERLTRQRTKDIKRFLIRLSDPAGNLEGEEDP